MVKIRIRLPKEKYCVNQSDACRDQSKQIVIRKHDKSKRINSCAEPVRPRISYLDGSDNYSEIPVYLRSEKDTRLHNFAEPVKRKIGCHGCSDKSKEISFLKRKNDNRINNFAESVKRRRSCSECSDKSTEIPIVYLESEKNNRLNRRIGCRGCSDKSKEICCLKRNNENRINNFVVPVNQRAGCRSCGDNSEEIYCPKCQKDNRFNKFVKQVSQRKSSCDCSEDVCVLKPKNGKSIYNFAATVNQKESCTDSCCGCSFCTDKSRYSLGQLSFAKRNKWHFRNVNRYRSSGNKHVRKLQDRLGSKYSKSPYGSGSEYEETDYGSGSECSKCQRRSGSECSTCQRRSGSECSKCQRRPGSECSKCQRRPGSECSKCQRSILSSCTCDQAIRKKAPPGRFNAAAKYLRSIRSSKWGSRIIILFRRLIMVLIIVCGSYLVPDWFYNSITKYW